MTEQVQETESSQSFIEHFAELRTRIIMCLVLVMAAFGVCYLFSDTLFAFLAQPLADAFDGGDQRRLIFTGLPEAFFTKMKLAFYAGLLVTFPFILLQTYLFLAPGLYKNEKKVLLPFLIMAPVLFVAGAGLAYFYVFPAAWQFFVGFEQETVQGLGLPVMLEARVGEYLSLVLQLIFAFGLAFQLPVLLMFLTRFGIVSVETLRKGRRYAAVIMVTLAAILTPPDIISQIGLFLALYLLYELSIVAGKLMQPSV